MKELVSNMLGYWKYQVDHDKCTPEELRRYADIGIKELSSLATAEDLAKYYNQSEANVRNVIHRNYAPADKKPKRRTFYDFGWFTSVMPKSWLKK